MEGNYKSMYNLLLKNYPQYEALRQELLKLFFRKALANGITVDCYVDLNSYLSSIYKRLDYAYDEQFSLCASVINFAAHLRQFFATRFSISIRVFFVYGSTRPIHIANECPEYNAHDHMMMNANPNIETIIYENLEMMSILMPYIPQVYFIRSNKAEPGVIIRKIIQMESKKGQKNPRLIFSKDLYDYQLVATCPNTHLIRVKKTMQGDQTFTVSYFDFYKKLGKSLTCKTPIGDGISPELYSFYMTLAGCRDRGIKSVYTYPNADKFIHQLLGEMRILNGYNRSFALNMETVFDTSDMVNIIGTRYRVLDMINQGYVYDMDPESSSIGNGIIDSYDPDSIRRINNQHFKRYPLDLNAL